MNKFILFFLVLFSLSCSGGKETNQPPILPRHDDIPAITNPNLIHADNWSFTLSGSSGWKKNLNPNEEVKAYYSNTNRECFILMVKRVTGLSLIEYVEISDILRTFGADRAIIEDIKINQMQALLITAELEGSHFYTWVIVKNGFGYSFSCGGARSEALVKKEFNFCSTMAETVEIE